jgi:putative ABC transport system permease protein
MADWLEQFAFRTDLGIGVFALTGGLVLVIALATVASQSLRAALAYPADAIRLE